MAKLLRDNGLTLVLLAFFLVSIVGQFMAGHAVDNHERIERGQAAISALSYLGSGEFISSVFENWESEFLQMAAYVVLTATLVQRGSAESNDPDAPERTEPLTGWSPWPMRAGGWIRALYARSLGISLALLFSVSFLLHWVNSARAAADDAMTNGEAPPTLLQHLFSAQLWFESFQNWQSEFLSTAVLVVLSIFLRQKGSSQSKPLNAPNARTGD